MVRVWLRPALAAALRRQAASSAYTHVALKAASEQTQSLVAVRSFSSKKGKKSIHDKFVDVEDETEVPPEVQFMNKQAIAEADKFVLESIEELELDEGDSDIDFEDSDINLEESPSDLDELDQLQKLLEGQEIDEDVLLDEDDEDAKLTDVKLPAKYELLMSEMELNPPEDDRLYVEMRNFNPPLSMLTDRYDDDDDNETAPFREWEDGMTYTPEMVNWMVPFDKRKMTPKVNDKPWKYYVRANHPDPVELALDVDLLRLFISPTGRIRPRRFTGLTAKQQRKLARSIKISRQLALLPFLSRYPDPSPEQWRAMEEDEIAKLTAEAEADDGMDDDDDDDDEFEMEEE